MKAPDAGRVRGPGVGSALACIALLAVPSASPAQAGASPHAILSAAVARPAPARASVAVLRRSGMPPVPGTGAIADARGIEVRLAAGGSQLVSWDEVRGFETSVIEGQGVAARPELRGLDAAGYDAALAMGKDLWRARIRIERGDTVLARPLLARHWTSLRGTDGPMAMLCAEGLLECALEAGDLRGAVEPWLAVARLREAGAATRFPGMTARVDAATGLLPALSPFVPSASRTQILAACDAAAAEGGAAATLASLLRDLIEASGGTGAAADAAATTTRTPPKKGAREPGVEQWLGLLLAIETAPGARERAAAVSDFDRAAPEPPPFLAAWRLAAIGANAARTARASVGTGRADMLERAALELLAVPASGLDRTGLVDAYALEMAEGLLREAGDEESAAQLAALRAEASGGGG